MKIRAIQCEYKKLCDFFWWCGSSNSPKMSGPAKKKIEAEVKGFITELNTYYAESNAKCQQMLKSENPNYNAYNKFLKNWQIFSVCINSVLKLVKTGDFYLDINSFKFKFSKRYGCDSARWYAVKFYLLSLNPRLDADEEEADFCLKCCDVEDSITVVQHYSNGKYEGTMNVSGNKRQGRGTYTWNNGDKYVGEWYAGKKHGAGEYFYSSGNKKHYVGNWHKDQICGNGTLTYSDGAKYIGSFRNDVPHGYGVKYYSNGATYSGIWEKGQPNGVGQYIVSPKNYYIGEFKNNNYCGIGARFYANGSVSVGTWKDGKLTADSHTWNDGENEDYNGFEYNLWDNGYNIGKENKTITVWYNGDIYVGDYKNGKRHGNGCYLWSNHDYYIGEWKNDNKRGKGIMHNADGTSKYATWIEGTAQAPILYYDIDGEPKQ